MSLKLVIPRLIYKEIMHYVDKSDVEISGLGTLTFEDETFRIGRIVLCKQKNSATSTDLDSDDVAKAMFELRNEPGDMRFWWHSHVNMGVFWSGTDKETMSELAEHGWFLSTVFNKKRELRTCLTFKQEQFGLYDTDEIETVVEDIAIPKEVIDGWDAQFKSKCIESNKYEPRTYDPESPGYDPNWWKTKSYKGDKKDPSLIQMRSTNRLRVLHARMMGKHVTHEEETEYWELMAKMEDLATHEEIEEALTGSSSDLEDFNSRYHQ